MANENKEIRIRAVIDAQAFDKSVQEIQQKLQRLVQQANQGSRAQESLAGKDTVMGKYAQQAFGDFSKDAQQKMQEMFQAQRREAVNQKITMKEKQQAIEQFAKIDENLTKQQKERLKNLKEELELLKEKHRVTLNTAGETQRAIDKLKMQEGGGGGEGGGVGLGVGGAGGGGMGKFQNLLKFIGVGALLKGAADLVLNGVGDIISRERKITQAQGAALNVASRELQEQFQGRGSRGMFFARERAEAMGMAETEQSRQSAFGTIKAFGGTALQLGGIGVAATGVGLGIGAGMMGIGSYMKGGIIGDERSRAAMFDREKYRAMTTQEGMQNYEANLAAIKARNPRGVMAQRYLEQNRGGIAGMQQQLGLNEDYELFGAQGVGVLRTGIESGMGMGGARFSQANIQGQIQSILGAGGTTGAGRGLGGFAAGLGRQFNLGNSGQLLGQLSGAGLNNQQTEETTKRLLAAAVKLGVDTSKMPQEMQRLTAMTAKLATAGGGFSEGAVETALAGVVGLDRTSIEAARSAEEMFKQSGKAAGGFEGQMGLGFLQSRSAEKIMGGKKLSAVQMNRINQLSYSEARDVDFERLAASLSTPENPVTAEQAKELVRQKDIYKQTRTSTSQKAIQSLGEFIQEAGAGTGPITAERFQEFISTGRGKKLYEEAAQQITAAQGERFSQLTPRKQETRVAQLTRMMTKGLEVGMPGAMAPGAEGPLTPEEQRIQEQMQKPEGRVARLEEGAVGTGDVARMKALNENIEKLKNAARSHSESAELYNTQFESFIKAVDKGAGAMETLRSQLDAVVEDLAEKGYVSTKPSGK
jgi:hypothetical protein